MIKILFVSWMKDENNGKHRIFTFKKDDDVATFKVGFEYDGKIFITSADAVTCEASVVEKQEIEKALAEWYGR